MELELLRRICQPSWVNRGRATRRGWGVVGWWCSQEKGCCEAPEKRIFKEGGWWDSHKTLRVEGRCRWKPLLLVFTGRMQFCYPTSDKIDFGLRLFVNTESEALQEHTRNIQEVEFWWFLSKFLIMCTHVWLCECNSNRGQKRASDSRKLGWHWAAWCGRWELNSDFSVGSVLYHWAISPAPRLIFEAPELKGYFTQAFPFIWRHLNLQLGNI